VSRAALPFARSGQSSQHRARDDDHGGAERIEGLLARVLPLDPETLNVSRALYLRLARHKKA